MNQRTCVGCRTRDEASNLVRCVLVDGVIIRDEKRRLPGRGAWLHDSDQCWNLAIRRGGFARAFRCRVTEASLAGVGQDPSGNN